MLASACYLLRGYGRDDRIVYGSGQIVPTANIVTAAKALFADPGIAYIHVRSASNNCFQCRLQRASLRRPAAEAGRARLWPRRREAQVPPTLTGPPCSP
jgi:Protein of unknown function (DUF1203)